MGLESISSGNPNKELAYLFGVYLTDGSVVRRPDGSSIFSMSTIDKDFAERTLDCLKKLRPTCQGTVRFREAKKRFWPDGHVSECQDQYQICVSIGKDMAELFQGQTGDKHHLPPFVRKASKSIQRWFFAGLLDGNGWISKTERKDYPGNFQYRIGLCGKHEGWIWELKDLLASLGIQTLKFEVDEKGRNVPVVRFGFKLDSFLGQGLFFTLDRKQKRLEELIRKRSETRYRPSA